MFTKQNILKSLMKQCYKGFGLYIENESDIISIGCVSWQLEIGLKSIPKKTKSAIIELIGELPEPGEAWKCWSDKDGDFIQRQLPGTVFDNIAATYEELREIDTYELTNIILRTKGKNNVAVYKNSNNLIVTIYDNIAELIDNDCTDTDNGEDFCESPKLYNSYLIWSNNTMSFRAHTRDITNNLEAAFLGLVRDKEIIW